MMATTVCRYGLGQRRAWLAAGLDQLARIVEALVPRLSTVVQACSVHGCGCRSRSVHRASLNALSDRLAAVFAIAAELVATGFDACARGCARRAAFGRRLFAVTLLVGACLARRRDQVGAGLFARAAFAPGVGNALANRVAAADEAVAIDRRTAGPVPVSEAVPPSRLVVREQRYRSRGEQEDAKNSRCGSVHVCFSYDPSHIHGNGRHVNGISSPVSWRCKPIIRITDTPTSPTRVALSARP
jgi:hypothetical protein